MPEQQQFTLHSPVFWGGAASLVATLVTPALPAAAAQASSNYSIETVAQGLDHAWGMTFLPDGKLLVTERPGKLKLINPDSGQVREISGVPRVDRRNQGGLLDVAAHPEFADNGWIYLTWAGFDDTGRTSTYLGRGKLDFEQESLVDLETLFVAEPHVRSTGHYGSRIVFDAENYLFMTVGDRQSKEFGPDHYSQDISNHIGTTLRLNDDGSVPADNPFVEETDARDEIYSYGHRNSQGMAIHPETGELWQNEHGEFNGDEINVVTAGGNYGWPVASYAVDYRTRERFADLPSERSDMVEPVHYWSADHDEGFPPSGFAFYDAKTFPQWQGNALMGTLKHEYLGRFEVDGHKVTLAERLLDGKGWRIRDVAVGPDDGFVYVLVDDSDAPLLRLRPADDAD